MTYIHGRRAKWSLVLYFLSRLLTSPSFSYFFRIFNHEEDHLNGTPNDNTVKDCILNVQLCASLSLTKHCEEHFISIKMCAWGSCMKWKQIHKCLVYFKALHVLQASSFLKGQPIILFPLLLSIFSRTTPSVKVVLWSLWKKLKRQGRKRRVKLITTAGRECKC